MSGSVGSDSQSTSKWSVRAVSELGSIKLLGLVSFPGWLDNPRGMYTVHIGLARYLNILVVDTQSVRIYIMISFLKKKLLPLRNFFFFFQSSFG